ncbi:MAG: hypothetical protein HN380_21770 [Victivallales bacterium]|nr:hypothetical protein [Victivallales bacterium]
MAKEKRRGWCRRLLLGKPGTRWWRRGCRLLVAVVLLLFLAIAGLHVFRKPWVEPVPGMSVAMTRPHVTIDDLGPDSAYKLLLAALAKIARTDLTVPGRPDQSVSTYILEAMGEKVVYPAPEPSPEEATPHALEEEGFAPAPEPVRVWRASRSDALVKLVHHPWPSSPPPPMPRPRRATELEDGYYAVDAYPAPPDPYEQAIAPAAPWTLEQYREILRLGAVYGPAMPLLDRALAAPDPQVPTHTSLFMPNIHFVPVRELVWWLTISAHIKAASGDYRGAYHELRRAIAVATLITRGGSWVDHSVSWRSAAAAAQAARTIALRYNVPPAVLRQAAGDFLSSADGVEPVAELVRIHFLPLLNFVPTYYSYAHFDINYYPESRESGRDYPDSCEGRRERVRNRAAFALAPLADSTRGSTARNLKSLCQQGLALAEKPYSPAVQDGYDALLAPWLPTRRRRGLWSLVFSTRDPLGYCLALFGGGVSGLTGDLHAKATAHQTLLRGTALLLAVRTHELERGELPDDLGQLVPAYLPRVPTDPFSGECFRYLRAQVPGLPPDAWAIYSVGGNCVDDGGTAYAPASYRPFDGPDLVFPSQDHRPDRLAKRPRLSWYPRNRSQPKFLQPGAGEL